MLDPHERDPAQQPAAGTPHRHDHHRAALDLHRTGVAGPVDLGELAGHPAAALGQVGGGVGRLGAQRGGRGRLRERHTPHNAGGGPALPAGRPVLPGRPVPGT
ncbi:hypothetical protein [Ornithinimicrobium kibberense]|uniref:hypothetical protein n=1 Tax=Ornithinimicrobium kibberense TaxID=282060 RepID=UPI003608D561